MVCSSSDSFAYSNSGTISLSSSCVEMSLLLLISTVLCHSAPLTCPNGRLQTLYCTTSKRLSQIEVVHVAMSYR